VYSLLPDEFNEGNFRLDFRANKQYSDINGRKVLFGSVMIAAKLEKPLEDVSQFKGVKLSYKKIFTDERGEFHQLYGYNDDITINQFQDNLSFSKKNVIRGLHTQREMPQDKLVQVIQGKILDVIVDYRKEESTYKKYFAIELDKTKQLFVPKGFLHGFLSLEDNTIVHYKVSSPRIENLEIAIDPFDSDLGVDWRIEHRDAILSNKDLSGFKFKDYF
jgi:dTDP-4-dehydrorhamnose 3,5-epimerase